jgi:hypothetical protein
MGGRAGLLKRKPFFIGFFAFCTIFAPFVSDSYGEEPRSVRYGISVFGGFGDAWHIDPDLTVYGVHPRIDVALHSNWDLEFEGNYTHWNIRKGNNLYFAGIDINLLFKPIRRKWGSLFLLGGAGIGYDSAGKRVPQIGDSHCGGILQGGVGVFYNLGKKTALRVEYRYYHLSEPFRDDRGLNSHNALIGISF